MRDCAAVHRSRVIGSSSSSSADDPRDLPQLHEFNLLTPPRFNGSTLHTDGADRSSGRATRHSLYVVINIALSRPRARHRGDDAAPHEADVAGGRLASRPTWCRTSSTAMVSLDSRLSLGIGNQPHRAVGLERIRSSPTAVGDPDDRSHQRLAARRLYRTADLRWMQTIPETVYGRADRWRK